MEDSGWLWVVAAFTVFFGFPYLLYSKREREGAGYDSTDPRHIPTGCLQGILTLVALAAFWVLLAKGCA